MAVIADIDEDKNLVEPLTRGESILVELRMFGKCESSLNSKNDISGGSDSDFAFPVFLKNGKIVSTFSWVVLHDRRSHNFPSTTT